MAKRQLVAIEHTMRFEDYAVQSKSANIGQQPKRKPPLQRRLIKGVEKSIATINAYDCALHWAAQD
jgi:hypothetical protein